jgi:hypothetical protein
MRKELASLHKRRLLLLSHIGKASDEIARIDKRITRLLEGGKPGAVEA